MKYCISNMAWTPEENPQALNLLKQHDIVNLELVPSHFTFQKAEPFWNESSGFNEFKDQNSEFCFISLQSLLFGTTGLELFNSNSRPLLTNYLKKILAFCGKNKIPHIVFGSPKNRVVPVGMSAKKARAIAQSFFCHLIPSAEKANVLIGLEPNSVQYGCNFLSDTEDMCHFVAEINSPFIRVNLDMSTMSLNNESIKIMDTALPLVSHIHISEPFLKPVHEGDRGIHRERAALIKEHNYSQGVSIEMKKTDSAGLIDVEKSLDFVSNIYIN